MMNIVAWQKSLNKKYYVISPSLEGKMKKFKIYANNASFIINADEVQRDDFNLLFFLIDNKRVAEFTRWDVWYEELE